MYTRIIRSLTKPVVSKSYRSTRSISWPTIKTALTEGTRGDLKTQFMTFAQEALEKQQIPPLMQDLEQICEIASLHYDSYKTLFYQLTAIEAAASTMRYPNSPYRKDPHFKAFLDMETGVYPLRAKIYFKLVDLQHNYYFSHLVALHQNKVKKDLETLLDLAIKEQQVETLDYLRKIELITEIRALRKALNPEVSVLTIANEGVIAVKTIEAATKAKMETLIICRPQEAHSYAASLATHRLFIDDPMDIEATIELVREFNKTLPPNYHNAIHPGYGYLSEESDFAKACEESGFKFVGPSSKAMKLLGDKAEAKKLAEYLGIPTIPGYHGEDQQRATLLKKGNEIGYPLAVKTVGGGGGIGISFVQDEKEFEKILNELPKEAVVILEKVLRKVRHIELQFFVSKDDKGNVEITCVGSRNCSLQRKRAKIKESAPAECSRLDEMIADGEKILKKVFEQGYRNAATMEFLVDEQDKFYFLEFNTRVQVEHPATDKRFRTNKACFNSIEAQIAIAKGKTLKSYLIEKFDLDKDDSRTAQEMTDQILKDSKVGFVTNVRINASKITRLGGILVDGGTEGIVSNLCLPNNPDKFTASIREGDYVNTTLKTPLIILVQGFGNTPEEADEDAYQQIKSMRVEGIDTNLHYHLFLYNYLKENEITTVDINTCEAVDAAYDEDFVFTPSIRMGCE